MRAGGEQERGLTTTSRVSMVQAVAFLDALDLLIVPMRRPYTSFKRRLLQLDLALSATICAQFESLVGEACVTPGGGMHSGCLGMPGTA